MASKLRVMAGTSPETMVPITSIVNTNKSHKLSSDLFEGEIVAHIKNFLGEDGNTRESEYFAREDRQGVTWSIQVRGRFLKPYSTDDILFGNTFDQPLKLPWGIGAVFKFMNYIDPTLEHDLQSNSKPWALSPLVSTMPHLQHQRIHDASSPLASDMFLLPEDEPPSAFPSTQSIIDSTPEIYKTRRDRTSSSESSSSSSSSIASTASNNSNATSGSNKLNAIKSTIKKVAHTRRKKTARASPEMCFENAAARRSYFSNAANRQALTFGPSDIITTDFCYGFIEFSPSLALRLPGGLSFDLMRYWGGQPVRFVCCERKKSTEMKEDDDETPWGRIFWCISIEMYEEEGEEEKGEQSV